LTVGEAAEELNALRNTALTIKIENRAIFSFIGTPFGVRSVQKHGRNLSIAHIPCRQPIGKISAGPWK
jgi:hypothetical protein